MGSADVMIEKLRWRPAGDLAEESGDPRQIREELRARRAGRKGEQHEQVTTSRRLMVVIGVGGRSRRNRGRPMLWPGAVEGAKRWHSGTDTTEKKM